MATKTHKEFRSVWRTADGDEERGVWVSHSLEDLYGFGRSARDMPNNFLRVEERTVTVTTTEWSAVTDSASN